MKRIVSFLCILWLGISMHAGNLGTVTTYDESCGMSQWHITQMLQDGEGYIWFATWNGLNRFDGYELVNFKSRSLASDRIRNICLNERGNLWCKIEDDVYEFDLKNYKFSPVPESEKETIKKIVDVSSTSFFTGNDMERRMTDRQGNHWLFSKNTFCRVDSSEGKGFYIPQPKPSKIKAFLRDNKNRYWITTMEDATVRVYSSDNHLIGYLNQQGRIQPTAVSLKNAVYSMMQLSDGTILMGTKPGSLIRLKETADRQFSMNTINVDCNGVYDIKQDAKGRIWLATFSDGLKFIGDIKADKPQVESVESTYLKKFRQMMFVGNTLLVTSTHGLLVGDVSGNNLRKMKFVTHSVEPERESSIDCNATMAMLRDKKGRIFITTESGGVNMIESPNLLSKKLNFKHFNTSDGFPTDITFVMAEIGERLFIVANTQIIEFNPDRNPREAVCYDRFFWHNDILFTEAIPLVAPDGNILFGTESGAISINPKELKKSAEAPHLVFTGYMVRTSEGDSQGKGKINRLIRKGDNIVLQPWQRDITIYFSSLDYKAPEHILYSAVLLNKKNAKPTKDDFPTAGKNRSISLYNLAPGKYTLWVTATNSDGVWGDVEKDAIALNIEVVPTFWETPLATVMYVLIVFVVIFIIVYTIFYIREIKKNQNETLQAYLSMLQSSGASAKKVEKIGQPQEQGGNFDSTAGGKNDSEENEISENEAYIEPQKEESVQVIAPRKISAEDDLFMKRVLAFVDEHIGDSDVNINDMASAAATSRSGLNRKMKELMGITPADFMREARMKKACKMLKETDESITEIAFSCGFSDAKYFSKCFKASIGVSPTDYRK